MGSMHTGLEDFGVVRGNPLTGRGGLSDLAEFFAERARGGVGLIVTGGVAPNRQGKVSPLAGKMSNGLEARAHREVTTLCMMRAPAKSGVDPALWRYGSLWNVAPSPIKAPIGCQAQRAGCAVSKAHRRLRALCRTRALGGLRRRRGDGQRGIFVKPIHCRPHEQAHG